MVKNRKTRYHILFWFGIYLFWVAVFRSYSIAITKTITIEFCYLIFITADYYAINNLIIPKFLFRKKYRFFISGSLLVIAISAWLRALVAVQMNLLFFHLKSSDFGTLYFNSFINILVWVLLITIGNMLVERIQTQQQMERLEKERVKNELDFLKAQINPHALFNSLNTIYGYIDKNNQEARNSLLHFSKLLRYQLYDCVAEKVSLGKELEYIREYVAFQRLRKDGRLMVNLDIEEADPEIQVVPLLLVVLIENAFKFVSNFPDKDNEICIQVRLKDNILCGYIKNTIECDQATKSGPGGIGIINLKRRLQLLYPHKHKLNINDHNGFYETELIIYLA
jgi:two-component system, LytTR family, sensor kinase